MAFKLSLVSDVREVLRDTGKVADNLDDVADALDDMAREAVRAGDKTEDSLGDVEKALGDVTREAKDTGRDLERSLEDGSREAGDAADQMEKKFRDALDKVRDEAKETGKVIDRETADGTGRAGEAASEFKDEAVQNFSEVASSFSGDMTSAVDGVQGLLGGLASSSIPGVGIAAGIAGLAMGAAFGGAQEEAEAAEERVNRLRDAIFGSGDAAEAVDEVWRETIAEWADPMTALGDNIVEARQKILDLGYSAEETDTIIRGIAGAPADIQRAQKLLNDEIDRTQGKWDKTGGTIDTATATTIRGLNELKSELDKTVGIQQDVTREFEATNDVIKGAPTLIKEAAKQQEAYLDSLTKKRTVEVEVDLTKAQREIDRWRPRVDVSPRLGQQVK